MEDTPGTPAPEEAPAAPQAEDQAPPPPPMSEQSPPPPPPMPQAAPAAAQSSNTGLVALLCWIFAPWGIIALFLDDYKNTRLIRSAAIQGAAVAVAGILLSSVTFGLASLAALIYQIFVGLKAYKGEDIEVPLVYGLVKSMIDQP